MERRRAAWGSRRHRRSGRPERLECQLPPVDPTRAEESEQDRKGIGVGLHRQRRPPGGGAIGEELLNLWDRKEALSDDGPDSPPDTVVTRCALIKERTVSANDTSGVDSPQRSISFYEVW